MAEEVTVKLLGFKELDDALQNLDMELAKKIVRKGCREGAKVIQQAAIRNAPEDTGTLKANIVVRLKKVAGRSVTYNIENTKKAWYAHLVEWGTQKHLIPKRVVRVEQGGKVLFFRQSKRGMGKRGFAKQVEHPGTKGKRFMTRAFDESKDAAVEKMRQTMTKDIEKAFLKKAKKK